MIVSRTVATLLLTPMLGSVAWGQLPGIATPPPRTASALPAVSSPLTPASGLSAPISAPPSPVGIAAYPPPPGGPTLGSFLGLSYAQREYRQRRLARTPLGKLRTRIQEPLSKITGGLIPPFPPATPSLAELQAPGPVGAMAKVKLDREAAGERIEAVRYLGKVDCHYWPEAGDALIDALRADRNEWVRLAAAETLGTGCCCTKKTIMALTMVVNCSIEDGNPVEKSPQVIAAAQNALANCLARACACETELYVQPEFAPVFPEVAPPPLQEREKGEEGDPTTIQAAWSKPAPGGQAKSSDGLSETKTAHEVQKTYYERVDAQPWGSVIAAAKNAMVRQPMVPADARLAGYRQDLERAGVVMTANQPDHSNRPANLLDMLLDDKPAQRPTVIAYSQQVASVQPYAAQPRPQQTLYRLPNWRTTEAPLTRLDSPAASPQHVQQTLPTPELHAIEPMPKMAPVDHAPALLSKVAEPRPVTQSEPVLTVNEQRSAPMMEGTTDAIAVQQMLSRPGDATTIREAIAKLTPEDLDSSAKLPLMLLRVAESPADPELRAACIRTLGRCRSDFPGLSEGLQRLVNERETLIRVEATLALEDRTE